MRPRPTFGKSQNWGVPYYFHCFNYHYRFYYYSWYSNYNLLPLLRSIQNSNSIGTHTYIIIEIWHFLKFSNQLSNQTRPTIQRTEWNVHNCVGWGWGGAVRWGMGKERGIRGGGWMVMRSITDAKCRTSNH